MKDFELLMISMIVPSESIVAAGAFAGAVFGGRKTTALFEPLMSMPRASCPADCGGMKTRSDFEPLITTPSDEDPLDEGGGKMNPSFELYMIVLPKPLAPGS